MHHWTATIRHQDEHAPGPARDYEGNVQSRASGDEVSAGVSSHTSPSSTPAAGRVRRPVHRRTPAIARIASTGRRPRARDRQSRPRPSDRPRPSTRVGTVRRRSPRGECSPAHSGQPALRGQRRQRGVRDGGLDCRRAVRGDASARPERPRAVDVPDDHADWWHFWVNLTTVWSTVWPVPNQRKLTRSL